MPAASAQEPYGGLRRFDTGLTRNRRVRPMSDEESSRPWNPPAERNLMHDGQEGDATDHSRGAFGSSDSQERSLEAATGVEPVMEVLQTSALPLGYAAPAQASLTRKGRRQSTEPVSSAQAAKEIGAGEGTRTLDLLHGKQTL
jgi:hypothetical protein